MPALHPPPPSRALRRGAAAVLLAALVGGPLAQDELALKAAIVANLLQFAQWPGEAESAPDAPLTLCADRAAALWPQLGSLQGRPVRGARTLALREAPATADGLRPCQAWLLEGGGAARRLPAAAAAGLPVLVIGDVERADEPGVVVGLRHSAGRLAFDVDLGAARRNGLQLSSKLLRLAGKVRE